MFWNKNKKNVYPCKPHFYYIKVGCKGVFTRTCFHYVSPISTIESNKHVYNLSSIMRTPTFYLLLSESKGADQLRNNRAKKSAPLLSLHTAVDRATPLLLKSAIQCLYLSSVVVQSGLCQTGLETLDMFCRDTAHI